MNLRALLMANMIKKLRSGEVMACSTNVGIKPLFKASEYARQSRLRIRHGGTNFDETGMTTP
jgi:hypothetical protein